ncbi:MAG: indole-3-glycerol-phosphate synthase [Phycisphaerae bacterium]|nr:MAG: indole-3-glycerol-phosphate synthase [Phycisphaerae bacterium]
MKNDPYGPFREPPLSNILQQIIADKRVEVEQHKTATPLAEVIAAARATEPPRDFKGALTKPAPAGIHLIAEIKRKSPSAGIIREAFEPARIAEVYQSAGASAISILTDEKYFDGKLEYIAQVRKASNLPLLRKDFTIDAYQIAQARAAGADAILLIAEVLSPKEIAEFANIAADFGLSALIEAHNEKELQGVLDAFATGTPTNVIIGINNRDLTIQKTDVATTARLSKMLDASMTIVSESGIHARDDVVQVQQVGAKAILVGESILKVDDMAGKIKELLGM